MIRTSREADVWTIALAHRELRNALDLATVLELRTALTLAADAGATMLVLRSDVPGVFCVGMDLEMRSRAAERNGSASVFYGAAASYLALLRALLDLPCLTVAVVDGIAVGGGVDLTASCDLVLATERAAFSIGTLRKGIFPLSTSAVLIPRIGEHAFLRWLVSGVRYSAARARKLGFVSEVVEGRDVDPRLSAIARRLTQYDARAMRLGLDELRGSRGLSPRERLDRIRGGLAVNLQLPSTCTDGKR